MPYIHPSMTDTELLRATETMVAQHVRVMRQRIQDRAQGRRDAMDMLTQLPTLIERGDLVPALSLIDRIRATLAQP